MSSDTIRLIAEFFAACVGTIAFALLFQVPRKYYLYCGIAGACGWICYKLILPYTTEPVSIFFATVLVIILSRSFAVYKRCPVTVFLIAGIFPSDCSTEMRSYISFSNSGMFEFRYSSNSFNADLDSKKSLFSLISF